MKTNDKAIKFLGLGLKRSRLARILEEYQSDSQTDPKAKRTAAIRTLKSYFWVSNLNTALLFLVGAAGLVATLKSVWIWAACLLLVTLFTTQTTSEETLASKAFKLYKIFVGLVVLVACYFSIRFDNLGDFGLINNLNFYLGNSLYFVGGAILLVTSIAVTVELFRTKSKLIQFQRLTFVMLTLGIYLSSELVNRSSYLIQIGLTLLLFLIALIKRKPALA